MTQWEIIVGLEVHAQISTQSKLFSGAATAFGAEPNTQVSFIDAAFPGMLPVLNMACVEQAVRTGLGLNATINQTSRFDRKNYFYADLPAGYQITQYAHPIVSNGHIDIVQADGSPKAIRINRLHIEQDAGKSLHDHQRTRIDLNRAGVPLMEIVTEPDIRSAQEANDFLHKLRSILRYLGTCDGNMEEGSLRADVNISVRLFDEPGYRTRCEIKNVNSFRFVMQAIEIEAARQIQLYESGGTVVQQTRQFDPVRGVSKPMRDKENDDDYRYFPDPDLLPLVLEASWIDSIKQSLPELPDAKHARFIRDYGLSAYDAAVLTADQETAEFYESVAKNRDAKIAANWMTGEFFAALKSTNRTIADPPISADALGRLLELIADGTINGRIGKDVFASMVLTGRSPDTIIDHDQLRQVVDVDAIDQAIAMILTNNPQPMADYHAGKTKLFGFFVGQTMKLLAGKGNPAVVTERLHHHLKDQS